MRLLHPPSSVFRPLVSHHYPLSSFLPRPPPSVLWLLLSLLCLLSPVLCPLSTATAATAAEPAASDLISPANKITLGQNDAPWTALTAALQAQGNVAAPFTEHRYLPFKKIPVVFSGDMRLSTERGLSLHYTSPEDRLMIVDATGVLLRDDRGRSRELPADPRAQGATSAMLHVMRFDFPALAKDFDLYGRRDGDTWQLAFEPRDSELAGTVSRIIVSGTAAEVRKLEMRKSALQRIEILVGEVHTQVLFTPDDLKKFFR